MRLGRRNWWVGTAAAAACGAAVLPSVSTARGAMATRTIPSSGEAIPAIGMGTWSTFDVGSRDYDERREVLTAFLQAGGRLIDSSPMYGRAEKAVGDLLPDSPRAFVATKVWTRGRAEGIREMKDSTAKLGGRVDLMQVHNLVDWRTHLPTLRAMKEAGTIRYIGVTHYQRSAFDELEAILKTETVDFVQLPYSVAVRQAEERLLPCAADTGTAVLVMRPFDGGSLFSAVRGRPVPAFATELGCASWGQLFLAFLLGHPAVTCPIPATSKPSHMRDNMGAADGPFFDAATRARVVKAVTG